MPATHRPLSHFGVGAVLRARNLLVEREARTVLVDVSVTIGPQSRLGVVGVNGSGKSTLLQVLAGRLAPTEGSLKLDPPSATVGYLPQESTNDVLARACTS